jgi:UDP-N-acetyl-D-mannosaminuronate dehydrogenase
MPATTRNRPTSRLRASQQRPPRIEANELAVAADEIGIDVMDVIQASNSQPFSHIHVPGIAVGGHRIPVYPHLLMGSTSVRRLASVAREISDDMPRYGVELLERRIGALAGCTVAVLGAAYRGASRRCFAPVCGRW